MSVACWIELVYLHTWILVCGAPTTQIAIVSSGERLVAHGLRSASIAYFSTTYQKIGVAPAL